MSNMQILSTAEIDIAYEDGGPPRGEIVILLHGFPYDPRLFDPVLPRLHDAGYRTIAPYLRGYGPTRLRPGAARSAEQAALAQDLYLLTTGLGLDKPLIAGFDWGARTACAAAALWPSLFRGVVAIGGYTVYDLRTGLTPAPPAFEHVIWYQYYFHGERGRLALERDRDAFVHLLWRLWSPRWQFEEAMFQRTVRSFHNPDFVDMVIHSYRHRFGLASGDPALAGLEDKLRALPKVEIPAIVLTGGSGAIEVPSTDHMFTALLGSKKIAQSGHAMPAEAPDAVIDAVLDLFAATAG